MLRSIEISRKADGADLRQCLYAAAFLVPGVIDVSYRDGIWEFALESSIDESLLTSRLDALITRYSAPASEPKKVFELAPVDGQQFPGLPSELAGVTRISQGLDIYSGLLSRLVRFLDDAILRRFAPSFKPIEETYPNVIPIESLWRANHLSGFPEHLHLVSHLESDVESLDAFATRARQFKVEAISHDDSPQAASLLAHNPSTCYHCYALRAGRDIGPDQAITAITRCHRYEAINHRQPGRLLEFSMREIIFLGTPDYVRATRVRSLELVEQMVSDWSLYGTLVTANDPFFSSDFSNKAGQQHRLAMKYEYKADLPPHQSISVLSSNLHGPTFSKAFGITQGRHPINTGCIGFGLERIALALIAQHGDDVTTWPAALNAEYMRWHAADPLST
ncbi:hypothetical protein RPMA_09790 [Tardiphaga alba]|uniref:Aminoacyl-transfer RNA synthetases class-II family profile domain-containing protein n=1 Tax=Tardiphaga alba TaxID=340268 RepID=A0ABX8A8U5_9BRAD|nr:hypothetical protein [Tardiphaga alba]QUS39094.1 hypothetical protein RPMA_09790 [Tardiphaga alba]